ncbi:hypothetical protein Salat_2764500 [Sesamum alatum]|uniref:Uncharacterized protein n=1 Tax=Sesamum alatum TaxID=300844 RepID=A0AAE1XLE0_9LAMI|nr:hypothetical protein Salat_2764500 [Sesamum alatum]
MADGTHLAELRKDVDALKDQVRVSSERSEKHIEEIRTIIAALAVHHSTVGASSSIEGAGNFQTSQQQGYQIPTKCSKVEFPKFDGDDLRGWVFRCEQCFEVDDTPLDVKVKLAQCT